MKNSLVGVQNQSLRPLAACKKLPQARRKVNAVNSVFLELTDFGQLSLLLQTPSNR
jgi:hypothetical protein